MTAKKRKDIHSIAQKQRAERESTVRKSGGVSFLAETLGNMGEMFAKGLVDAAKIKAGTTSTSTDSKIDNLNETIGALAAEIKKGNERQEKLFEALLIKL